MDDITAEQRKKNMKAIQSKDTKPELIVRKYLFSKGLRYRKNDKRYPGHPDIVLPKYKTVIFVNGCFWHQHPGCKYAAIPESNQHYWIPKLKRNVQRDKENYAALKSMGWKVIVVWECMLSNDKKRQTLNDLFHDIQKKL